MYEYLLAKKIRCQKITITGILHVRPKVVYTFCDFEKICFFLSATFAFRISMLQEIEKIRDFHFVKKCKLSNEGCPITD
jgi:hypothetical protein